MNRADWERDVQSFERNWWGDCASTYGEETKQVAYARVMGLDPGSWRGGDAWPRWDMAGKRILDVGGGPVSMLLKSSFDWGVVVDPCTYPSWTTERYATHGVVVEREPAEDYLARVPNASFDEAWCYNCLQHTLDPEAIVHGMRRAARTVRLFEWVDQPPHEGHPHELTSGLLAEWLGINEHAGRTVWFSEQYEEVAAGKGVAHGWGGAFS